MHGRLCSRVSSLPHCLTCHNIRGTDAWDYTLQVELNPSWQQRKLIEFCKDKGIHVTAYSPLGGQFRSKVLPSKVLDGIAKARGKSVAQVSTAFLRNPSLVIHLITRVLTVLDRIIVSIMLAAWLTSHPHACILPLRFRWGGSTSKAQAWWWRAGNRRGSRRTPRSSTGNSATRTGWR